MTPDDFTAALKALGLTQRAFSNRTGVSERTCRGYVSGQRPIPRIVEVVLHYMAGEAASPIDKPTPAPPKRKIADVEIDREASIAAREAAIADQEAAIADQVASIAAREASIAAQEASIVAHERARLRFECEKAKEAVPPAYPWTITKHAPLPPPKIAQSKLDLIGKLWIRAIEDDNDGSRLNAVRSVSKILKDLHLHAQDINFFAGSIEESTSGFRNLAWLTHYSLARVAGLSESQHFLMEYLRKYLTDRQWLWVGRKVNDVRLDAEDAYLKKHGLTR